MPYRRWHALLSDERYSPSSGMIRDYLELTEGLESPTPYHIWSLLSLFAALAGGRIYFDHGAIGKKRLNLGVVLIGFPAIRKSSAITVMQQFSQGLPLQYGPTDTGGQRQGIMTAMLPRWQYDHMESKDEYDISETSLEALSDLDTTGILPDLPSPRIPPASELYFAAKELGRLLASPSREMLDFFTDAFDGESFHYQLKTQSIRIPHPLVNILGATTPGSLSQLLPRGATEHGFLSRLIFVYADRLAARNPSPQRWTVQQQAKRDSMLGRIEETLDRVDGPLTLTENAERTYKAVYTYTPAIKDVRLQAYAGRRSDHLLKIAGVLALMRGALQQEIVASDVRLAHALLCMTEGTMGRAFYGLDQRVQGKVQLGAFEYLESLPDQKASREELHVRVSHLGTHEDITKALVGLTDGQEGKLVDTLGKVGINTAMLDMAYQKPFSFFKGATGFDEFRPMLGG